MISSSIGSAGGSIHWEEYGVGIEIPPGAITSDVCQHFHLTCYIPEKAKFQESYISVGPLFTIRPSYIRVPEKYFNFVSALGRLY